MQLFPKVIRYIVQLEKEKAAAQTSFFQLTVNREGLPETVAGIANFAKLVSEMDAGEKLPKFRPISAAEIEAVRHVGNVFHRRLSEALGRDVDLEAPLTEAEGG